MSKERNKFKKGDKVWVRWVFTEQKKGVIKEVFSDGSYLVKIRWWGFYKRSECDIEKRSNWWGKWR